MNSGAIIDCAIAFRGEMAYIRGSKLYIPPKSAHESDAAGVDVIGMASTRNHPVECGGIEPVALSMSTTS
jgi:hypothetical protein